MVKIRKYTLKKKHKNRLTGGSDNIRNLNRRERRKLSRTLPKLQAVIRRRISNNSPSPVLPEPPMIIPQTSPITVPQTSPITVPRTYPTTRRRRGWRSQRGTPILWYNLSPEQYLRQTQHYIPILQPIPMPASNIPATEPIPIDSDGNEIINVNDESNNEYILSIDRKGNVTVLKDGSSPIEGGGKSSSRHSPNSTSHPNISIDGLINIFLHFCNKYEYNSVGLWRNRNVIGREYNNDIRKDVFRLSDALNEYNASVDDSNQYSINSYMMNESLELIPISFKTLFVDNHDDVGSYYSTIALLDFDLNTVGVDRNGNIVNLLEYAETYLKREIEIRDELVEVIRNNNEENINPNVRNWIETANDEIIDYEWKIDVLRALYAIKDAKFKESKRQRESSNYKLANIPDDISNELAKFQFGGAPVSPDNEFFYSMINNDLEGMRKAIESGANVNIQYHHGTSPLIFLAESESPFRGDIEENIEMVDLLLTNNANPNLQDKHGNTALHWAAARGYLKFVEKLIEKKAETNIQNLSGFNPLHSVLEDEEENVIPMNVEPIMKLLIQNGINVNHKDWNENTPLHLATENNNSLAIGILLRAGANENIRNYNGKTPHEIALENINGGRFEVEPEQDALPSIEAFGAKALRAFADFRREKAQAYLAGRAQANRRDATYLAEEAKNEDSYLNSLPNDLEGKIRKMMFGGAWTSNAVWSAVLYGHSPNVKKLKLAIESGADVNVQNHNGTTPLICLSSGYRMSIEMVDLLLTNNADPNVQDNYGETALHWAAFRGYLIVVKRLLESENIDINITNEYGGNALHSIFKDEEPGPGNYANFSGEYFDNVEPIVKLLIEKGININETDDDGKTPLHLAAEQNHGGAVGILLRAGADENIKTYEVYWRNGQTAYELAENIRNMIELQRDASVTAMLDDDDAAASDDDDSTSIDADRRHYIYVKRNCPWHGVIDVLQKTSLSSDNEYSLWAYEPLALNAFHQFHREKAQAYLAEEAKNEDSYLNSLPDELEEGIRNMFGGRNYDNDLLDAAASKNLEQMRIAIESGANVNVTNHRSISPLISLAKSWGWLNIEMVDLLLTNNADPNLQDRGGETALHWAAARGYLEMVKKLLESENIDINITNIDGRNALHSIFDDEEELFDLEHVEPIIKLLIEKGININETDNSGKTALHLASEQNNGNAVGILLRAGADENIKTDDYHPAGQTAYELAKNKKNRIELDRHNSLGEIIPGGDLVERLRITQIERDLVRAVMTVGEEEHSFQIPRDILVDTDHNLWTYEPLALNAFHEFHREKAQAYLAGRAQANRRQGAYLAQGTRDKGSILHSLPNDLEGKIRKMMFGGGQIFSSNKKDYELEFLNNELSKTRKRYNTYGKLLAVNQLIPKNVDNDIWDFAMKCYNIYKKNYVPHEHAPASAAPPLHSDRHATMIQTMVRGTLVRGKLETERLFFDKMLSENANQPVILIDWMQTWIDEDTLELIEHTMRFIWNRPGRADAWPEPAIIGNSNTTDILRSFKKAFSINSTPEIVLIVYLKVLAFIIEYNYLGLTLDDVDVEGKEVAIKRLDAIFKSIYNKENYELSLHKVNFENPFIELAIDTREMTEIIDYITFYKEIAIESLTTIYELFEKHDNVFEYLLEQVKKNDKIDKEQDQKKMYKLRKRRVNMWGKHYRHPINRLPEDIEAKIDENLL